MLRSRLLRRSAFSPRDLMRVRVVIRLAFVVGLSLVSPLFAAEKLPPAAEKPVDFARDVRPILERHCYACHGPAKQKSSFRLDRRSAAMKGGDMGPGIVSHKSAESPLIRYVAGLEEGLVMPPEGKRLSALEIGILRRWIDDGASWPDQYSGEPMGPVETWWSFKALQRPAVPEVAVEDRLKIKNPIDAFIVSKLRKGGLEPAQEADRRTLIRRLTLDLHGLPPTLEEVRAFEADPSADAYEKLVDRLLSSERYGERWARHWLDVAHYADSHGHDQDRPRPNAWPYRDYLIKAFNNDLPYGRFVAEQVAGDVLFPQDPAAIQATGFLAAGPFDESSLMSIQEDSIDRVIGQYLDRDDIVTTTMSAFNGLTVGCARCHDHKFDPIPQQDYYALQAVFAGIDKAERLYDADPKIAQRRKDLKQQLEMLRGSPTPGWLTSERRQKVADFEKQRAGVKSPWQVLEPTEWKAGQGSILKALLDRSILAMGPRPERDTYTVTLKSDLPTITGLQLEVLTDETLPKQGPGRMDNGNFHLSAIRLATYPQGEPAKRTDLTLARASADFNQENWEIQKALDKDSGTAWGIHPAEGRSHVAVFEFDKPVSMVAGTVLVVEMDQLHGGGHLIGRFRFSATSAVLPLNEEVRPLAMEIADLLAIPAVKRNDAQTEQIARWLERRHLERELATLPTESKVFCGTNQFAAAGSFRPVTVPRTVHVLARGDIHKQGAEAVPGALHAVPALSARFTLSDPKQEGVRRAALAQWLADEKNPLTWRVMANRVWHYHFGKGIVDTPNDFGKMGGSPSHPELLEWLACELRDNGGSLKKLHRLIVTSGTYRQRSEVHPKAVAIDGENRLLSRMNRRRMDAESFRDAVLMVSGHLDSKMYGPPAMQFVIKPGVHVTPDARYEEFNVDSPESRRRSIYRFILRTRPDPLLEVLDSPDASQSAPVRGNSVSPLQALSLWNNPFMLRYAEHLAEQAIQAKKEPAQQVEFCAQAVLLRSPSEKERQEWGAYVQKYGLANFCRVLLNSSEFLFID